MDATAFLPLFFAYNVFTLVAGGAQDYLYTEYHFKETDALSLVQSFVLFTLGALSYLWKSSRSATGKAPAVDTETDTNPETPKAAAKGEAPASPHGTPVPWLTQLALGVSIAGNVLLTNYATEFLSFPVQVIFKSSKLLVAMGVRAILFKVPNPSIDYYCGFLLTCGLVAFMWPTHTAGATEGGEDFHSHMYLGVVCIVGAVISEAAMLNLQEFVLFKKHKVSTEWVMMYGYLYSVASQVSLLVIVGKFLDTLEVLTDLDTIVQVLLLVFPVFTWIGVTFLLLLIKHQGAVAASAANVCRKLIAVLLSWVYFARPLTPPVGIGMVLVFSSVVWRAYVGAQRKKAATAPKPHVVDDKDLEAANESEKLSLVARSNTAPVPRRV